MQQNLQAGIQNGKKILLKKKYGYLDRQIAFCTKQGVFY